MYGYREIDGHCVDCMTFLEAIEDALVWAEITGHKQKIIGEHIQHYHGRNIASSHVYCWHVSLIKDQYIGNQRTQRIARSNGRAIPESSKSESSN